MMTAFDQASARGATSLPLVSALVALGVKPETFCAIGDMILAPTYFGGLCALPAPCACCECPTCDARVDRWHDGYFAHRSGSLRPADTYAAEGWNHRAANLPWEGVAAPERPEGYYHAPIGAFD